ncbi:hypothetical protein FRACYDRAFT_255472 [Fragilariopsis cylindrus CCMP1102]|uniref:Uncharacterized protein n=1 Tax=Fragilariopsis cylindrus CCMP1102 TaxID=635003 RepID=A0A1E7EJZ9_9STRA|nr:hypothetical protein FRACYDRAFT_255472 [Fragilariopsis cylindrus CCMP1102]|eukprot:OEU06251.1 hypothetical protein FRACYDRAFT_255472 [Fragilariopsis cylindrus CCMP1102]
MMNDESTDTTVSSSVVTKFQLLIDGCNGPIRFRERNLRRDHRDRDDGYSDDAAENNNDNDDNDNDNVILSFLRPDSISEETHNNYYKKTYSTKSSKQTKKTKKNGGNNSKSKNKTVGSGDSSSTPASRPNSNDPERLDMIPLLKKLLKMKTKLNNNEYETENDDSSSSSSSLFHSVSVVFDGISMTKRPSIPIPLSLSIPPPEDGVVGKSSQQDINHDSIEERERIWLMQQNNNDHPNSAILLLPATIEAGGENGNDNDNESSSSSSRNSSDRGTIKIEITGLYDEADNVIVDRIVQLQEKHQGLLTGNSSRRRIVSSSSSLKTSRTTDTQIQKIQTQIQIIQRTEQGPGKNRCLLQSIGLLRSESVACIFDFDLKDATTFARLTKDGQKTIKSLQRNRLLSSTGMIDIETTTISHPQMKDDIEGDGYEEKKEEDYRTATKKQKEDNTVVIIVPIVVTDDVFLRQRIIEDTPYYHSYADSSNNSGNGNGNGNDDNDNDDNLIFAGEDDNDVEVVSNHSNNRRIKGGYVLTFHQLWHMLMDVKNT